MPVCSKLFYLTILRCFTCDVKISASGSIPTLNECITILKEEKTVFTPLQEDDTDNVHNNKKGKQQQQQRQNQNKQQHTSHPLVPGAKGLPNLGNTCFFNSIMQSIVQTDLLIQYFLSERRGIELPLTDVMRKFFFVRYYLQWETNQS